MRNSVKTKRGLSPFNVVGQLSDGNVLLLDDPSNDLDVETLRALEDALLEFAGCMLVIMHDRWFLDRIATHIFATEARTDPLQTEQPLMPFIKLDGIAVTR